MNPKLVSIITPAWKAADYIEQTISSVQSQTYKNWEMLIVDDCSPDNSCEIIEKAIKDDARIHLIRQKENGGPATARNTAIEAAQGRWIAFLDSDDLWLPEKLERQIAFHEAKKAKISFTEFRRISADSKATGKLIRVPSQLDYKKLLSNTAIATSTVIIDRQISGPFVMKKIYYDDFGCWLDLLRSGGIASGLQEDLMRYRVLDGSVSRNKWRSAKEVWKTYRCVEKLNWISSLWHFSNYAINGILKYRHF